MPHVSTDAFISELLLDGCVCAVALSSTSFNIYSESLGNGAGVDCVSAGCYVYADHIDAYQVRFEYACNGNAVSEEALADALRSFTATGLVAVGFSVANSAL
jgi:hypothetical protein